MEGWVGVQDIGMENLNQEGDRVRNIWWPMGSLINNVKRTVKGLWRNILLASGMRMVVAAMVYRQRNHPLTTKSSCLDSVAV